MNELRDPESGYWVDAYTEWVVKVAAFVLFDAYDGTVVALKCGYVYHQDCLEKWVNSTVVDLTNAVQTQSPIYRNNKNCCVCNSPIVVKKTFPNYVNLKAKLNTEGMSGEESKKLKKNKRRNARQAERRQKKQKTTEAGGSSTSTNN